jgi:P27 family predicted phage terminase small subunit
MANPRVPTSLKVLRGNPGKRPLPQNEPQPAATVGAVPPKGMNAVAEEHWRYLAPRLEGMRVLTDADLAALEVLCDLYARWKTATQKGWKLGMLYCPDGYSDDGKPLGALKVNPYIRIAQDAEKSYLRALASFGMTPESRSRVEVAGTDPAETNPFLKLERRRSGE